MGINVGGNNFHLDAVTRLIYFVSKGGATNAISYFVFKGSRGAINAIDAINAILLISYFVFKGGAIIAINFCTLCLREVLLMLLVLFLTLSLREVLLLLLMLFMLYILYFVFKGGAIIAIYAINVYAISYFVFKGGAIMLFMQS